jgi:ATP-dependent Clp protease protease subunit
MEIDIKLQNTKNSLGDEFDPVCHLHLNTPGGEIYSALSTVDTIKSLKSKVYTYIDGAVASAGTLISTVGAKRFSGEHGHMLIHQLSSGMYGKFAEMEDDFYNSKNLMKVLKDFYKKNTKIPMKKLDELLKRDIWLTAKECLQYGIIDEIR